MGFLATEIGVGKPVVTITPEGSIVIGEGYTPTEAGEAFIQALAQMGVIVRRNRAERWAVPDWTPVHTAFAEAIEQALIEPDESGMFAERLWRALGQRGLGMTDTFDG